MWIRSQDKELLTNGKDVICIYCYRSTISILFNNRDIGKYSSKEKALKALDMIENAIGGVPETDTKGNIIGIAIKKIFQIPKDEEV